MKNKHHHVILMPETASVFDDAWRVAEYARRTDVGAGYLDVFAFTETEWDRRHVENLTRLQKNAKTGEEFKYRCTFHILNELDLTVREMITKHPPCKCPGLVFDENGVAQRPFSVMIVGFGQVGRQAFLRLMMNGQFVTRGGELMRAIVVDKNKKCLEEHFHHRHPALKLCCEFEFEDFDVQTENFRSLFDERTDLDYVVVALDKNSLNKQVASDIRCVFERKGLNPPFIALCEENECSHDIPYGDYTSVFGSLDEIYKYSVIIRDDNNRMAEAVHKYYTGGKTQWHEIGWFLQESNRAAADFIPVMLKLAGIDEEQAIKNGTLAEKGSVLAENLAITEHLRWNAFHAAMEYRKMEIDEMCRRYELYKTDAKPLDRSRRCSDIKMQVCIATWDYLDEISKAYKNLARLVCAELVPQLLARGIAEDEIALIRDAESDDENYVKLKNKLVLQKTITEQQIIHIREQNRNFKENDRHIIKSIPDILKKKTDIP